MKTVPTVRVADTADDAALPDLPDEIRLALADIAGAARDGLLAMSVAAGLAVMRRCSTPRSAEACGPKGRHDPDRAAVRHGAVGLGHAGWPEGSGDPTAGAHRRRA